MPLVCRWRPPFKRLSLPLPSMLSSTLRLQSPCLARLKPSSLSFHPQPRSPPVQAAPFSAPGAGASPFAVSACLCGTATQLAAFVVKFGDHPFLLRWGRQGSPSQRHRNVVCCAVAEFTSVSFELEKPGLLVPRVLPTQGGRVRT